MQGSSLELYSRQGVAANNQRNWGGGSSRPLWTVVPKCFHFPVVLKRCQTSLVVLRGVDGATCQFVELARSLLGNRDNQNMRMLLTPALGCHGCCSVCTHPETCIRLRRELAERPIPLTLKASGRRCLHPPVARQDKAPTHTLQGKHCN